MSSTGPSPMDSTASQVANLRPLSIGEILDRAFSISFKHLIAFGSIVLVVVGPQLLLYYLGAKPMLDLFSQQIVAAQHAASAGHPAPIGDPSQLLSAESSGTPFFGGTMLVSLLFVPLANAAVVSGVSRAYLGLPVRFRECYADAIPRWVALLILMVFWFVAAFVAAIAAFLVFLSLTFAITGLFAISHNAAVGVVGAILGVALGIGVVLLVLQVYLAAAFSFTAAILEGLGPAEAFSSGFKRVFGEGQFWRSLGIAAALLGIFIGFSLVGGVIGFAAIFALHSFAFNFAVSALVNAFLYPFAFAVVAVSYYDVRIRREGFDLQLLAARLSGQTAR